MWDREYSNAGFDWSAVQKSLLNSALPITVKAINQRTGAASLDYAVHKESGLRVIAVGGNSLSRGLTLEGLSTSYFFRNSQMYDTLLQMGRWFGYRDGYADLCRLWITDEAAQWYAHITSATEELRDEVKRMRQQRATPLDFGLKVRAHPDSLLVTAQNKMRQAKTMERVISLSGQLLETARLKSNTNSLAANRSALVRFLDQLQNTGLNPEKIPSGHHTVWRGVPKELVASLLRDFDVHPLNVAFQTGDLATIFRNHIRAPTANLGCRNARWQREASRDRTHYPCPRRNAKWLMIRMECFWSREPRQGWVARGREGRVWKPSE